MCRFAIVGASGYSKKNQLEGAKCFRGDITLQKLYF